METDIKMLFPAPTHWVFIYTKDQKFSHEREIFLKSHYVKQNIEMNSWLHIRNVHMISMRIVYKQFGPELGLFLVRSSILLTGSLFWPMRYGMVPYSLVALLAAVLLKRMKWVNTGLFHDWPKWYSPVAQQIGMN